MADKAFFIGGPGTLSASAIQGLLERGYQVGVFSTQFPLTIVRPSYAFGPRFILSFMSRARGVHMLRRLQTGRPVLVPGDGTTLMHVGSAYNTGKMIAALVDFPPAIGKDYTCGHPTFTTHDGYVQLFARALGVQPNIVHIPTDLIAALEYPEIRGCLLHALTRLNVAFSIDRFLRDLPLFRWDYTLDDWARYVVEQLLSEGAPERADEDILDDRIIGAYLRAVGGLSL